MNTWDSGLNIIENPKVLVPRKIVAICKKIQERVGNNEFSILVKGRWEEKGFRISEEFIIPKQEVGTASVDYIEPLEKYKQQGFNTVIHSHPFSNDTDFSQPDRETINTHFTCSLLFTPSGITKGVLSVQVNSHIKLQIPVEIEIEEEDVEIPKEMLENIRERPIIYYKKKKKKGKVYYYDEFDFAPNLHPFAF